MAALSSLLRSAPINTGGRGRSEVAEVSPRISAAPTGDLKNWDRDFVKVDQATLLSLILLHSLLLEKPEPIPEDSDDPKWKYFKNCLGALDGTHVKVIVPVDIKRRYRSRKAEISTNVLGVCGPDMKYIYMLPGWEGSAHDGRVLRDAISRPNGLRVPADQYYLVDARYTNGKGFLAPYRGQRYHIGGWTAQNPPNSAEEYFNMCHAKARNIVERSFARIKNKWAILRSPCFL
ncbi:protein ALP1-like [Brachypodium distachyon]|uniref:protein ALP1-like n=1 Tax=Brachypodium distachyon TaxID=15368 RepID=UPI00052FFEEF|nr:protein ALP1-like [Brachypodium distachyon]|eukprot:XP_010233500.1 protein ALP1-like [Brachypodium distachyon]